MPHFTAIMNTTKKDPLSLELALFEVKSEVKLCGPRDFYPENFL